MSLSKYLIATASLLLINTTPSLAGGPWIAQEGESSIFTSYVYDSADTFFSGSRHSSLPFGDLEQQTWTIGVEHGLTDSISVEATTGYTKTNGNAELGSEEGLNDSRLGLRWRVLDEFSEEDPSAATVTLNSRIIIPGSYEEDGFPIAPGDRAFGGEFSTSVGKILNDNGLGVFGEFGIRVRENPVPDDLIFNVGLFQQFFDNYNISAEYRREMALSGIDLGTEAFTPDRARELDQEFDNLEFNLGYTHDPSGVTVGFLYGVTLNGKNTTEKDIFGVSLSYSIF